MIAAPVFSRRIVKILLPVVVVVLLVGLVRWRQAAADNGKRDRHPPQVVTVTQVATRDMALHLMALGTVTPNNTVTVRSRVDGQLMRLNFAEGQQVKAGQLLAELDARPFQAQVEQARGQLAHDEALLQNAQLDLTRYRTLLEQNSIAEQQVATQQALVRQYRGTVAADRGTLANARLQLTYTRITAPVSGRVGLKQVDMGNIVHASDTNGVVVITEMQPSSVVFAIPADRLDEVLPALNAGRTLPVEAWDRDNRTRLADGQLMTADNQVDTATGTVKLKARFANRDNALFPNQFVNVRLQTTVRQGARVIPTAALQRGTPGSFVYLVKPDNTVSLRVVTPGPAEGDWQIVEQGLKPGDRVVLSGVDRLRDGARVVVAGAGGGGQAHGRRGAHEARR